MAKVWVVVAAAATAGAVHLVMLGAVATAREQVMSATPARVVVGMEGAAVGASEAGAATAAVRGVEGTVLTRLMVEALVATA